MASQDEPSDEEEEIADPDTGPRERNGMDDENKTDAESDPLSDTGRDIGVGDALELVKEGRTDEIPDRVLTELRTLRGELGDREDTENEEEATEQPEGRADTDLEERVATLEDDVSVLREDLDSDEQAGTGTTTEVEQQVTAQAERLAQLESEFEAHRSEFEEHREQAQRERERIRTHNLETFALRVVRVKDQVENMLELGTFDGEAERRLEMLDKQLEQALKRSNVERIDTDGEYNLQRHEVVGWEASEEHDSGEITQIRKAGYQLGGRVIRKAEVVAVDDS